VGINEYKYFHIKVLVFGGLRVKFGGIRVLIDELAVSKDGEWLNFDLRPTEK